MTKQADPIGNVLSFDYDDLGRLLNKHVPGKLLSRFLCDNEKPTDPNVKIDGAVAWFDWGLNSTHTFTLPSWASVHTVSNLTVDTATSSLKASATQPNYYGYISHRISDTIDEPLILTVTFRDNPGSYIYVQLRDANWQNIVNNVVGNLASGSGRIVTKRITVDFQSNPTLRYILVYRYYGDVEIFDTSISRAQIGSTLTAVNAPESIGRPFSVQNGIGLLTAFADSTGQTAFSYDLRGRKTAERKVIEDSNLSRLGYVTDTTYTPDNLPLTMRYPNNEVVTYGYDAARRLASLLSSRPTSNSGGQPIQILSDVQYDSHGLLSHLDYGNDQTHTDRQYYSDYTYWSTDLHLHTLISWNEVQSKLLQSASYSYDEAGNVKNITDGTTTDGTRGAARGSYVYDDLDRLLQATIPSASNPSQNTTQTFAYDSIGRTKTFEGRQQEFGQSECSDRKPHQLCRVIITPNVSARTCTTMLQAMYSG